MVAPNRLYDAAKRFHYAVKRLVAKRLCSEMNAIRVNIAQLSPVGVFRRKSADQEKIDEDFTCGSASQPVEHTAFNSINPSISVHFALTNGRL